MAVVGQLQRRTDERLHDTQSHLADHDIHTRAPHDLGHRLRQLSLGALAMKYTLLATLLLASTAAAQDVTPTFHAEGAAQVMLSSALRDRFDWGGAGTARAGLEVIGPLAIQTSFGTAIFPVRNQAPGNLFAFELGVRGFFRVGDAWLGGPFVDANAGIGMTGDLVRFLFDIGAG